MSSESSWSQRVDKVGRYLAQGDLAGLKAEIHQFLAWKERQKQLSRGIGSRNGQPQSVDEAKYWDEFDADLARRVSWTSAGEGMMGAWAFEKFCHGQQTSLTTLIRTTMTVSPAEPRYGLVLGCGDMAGEHTMFIDPQLPFAEIDAYDISPKSIERARHLTDGKGLKVNYYVDDVNQLTLPADHYAFIVIFHSYHHFEQVDHIAQQVNKALRPGGVFYTVDYVGARKLQWTDLQLSYARPLLQLLPEKYRRDAYGQQRQTVNRVPESFFSPDEAICSDLILSALDRHLQVIYQYNWAGLLYPLLEGIAFNFTTSEEDLALLRLLFNLDCALCQSGAIEPNFTLTLAMKR
jgi:SAM-dependent methyltransferase